MLLATALTMPGGFELLIILFIFLLLFGAKRLPEFGKSIGQTVRNLRKGFDEDEDLTVTREDN